MPENFLHGVSVVEVDSGPRSIRGTSSSVIGIVGTAENADAEAFPLNKPVLISGSLTEAAKLGISGTLPSAINGIFAQGGANIVVIRVAEGSGETAETDTIANVIGAVNADGTYSGMQSLLAAQSTLGVTPHILLAPGFSHNESVAVEFLTLAERLHGIFIADAPDIEADAVDFADNLSHSRAYVVYPKVINTKNETVPASSYVAGIIAKTDNETGFWCSPSNKKINGIIGLSKSIDFSLGDFVCKANYLNENNIATIINQDGYRLWGNRTCSSDSKWQFLSVRRTADIIDDSILRAHLWAVDRNIVKNYVTDVVESVNAYLANLKSLGAIIDGKCFANDELNTPTNIADGKIYFDFEFVPSYPAEKVTFRSYLDIGLNSTFLAV
ncbi:bacteriophage protein [Alphaproteobacteria bacterium]|nr:bacteriophage protein [Alphaproteobacteria bacterium]